MAASINEQPRILNWLDTTLYPLAPGGAWEGIAPEDVTAPYIVYQQFGGLGDIAGAGGVRLWVDTLWLVTIWCPATDYATLQTIADGVDNALQMKGNINIGPAGDVRLLKCYREQPVPVPSELVNNVLWSRLAATWRILAKNAAV